METIFHVLYTNTMYCLLITYLIIWYNDEHTVTSGHVKTVKIALNKRWQKLQINIFTKIKNPNT